MKSEVAAAEAAEMLHVHRTRLWHLVREGRIDPSRYVNRRFAMFDVSEVKRLGKELASDPRSKMANR